VKITGADASVAAAVVRMHFWSVNPSTNLRDTTDLPNPTPNNFERQAILTTDDAIKGEKEKVKRKQRVRARQHVQHDASHTMLEITCNDRLGKKVRVKCKYASCMLCYTSSMHLVVLGSMSIPSSYSPQICTLTVKTTPLAT
jgi:hypothetical protein